MHCLVSSLTALLLPLFFITSSVFGNSLVLDGKLVHDTDLQIDWMRDGNWDPDTGTTAQAPMTWDQAKAWVTNLNQSRYGGFDDWRLPSTPAASTLGYTNTAIYNVTTSELGHLYYSELGLKGKVATVESTGEIIYNNPFGLGTSPTPFEGLQSALYWFGTESSTTLDDLPTAWAFDFAHGSQFLQTTKTFAYAIAVRSAVPEPASAFLFLSGLTGTLWHLRRKRK